MISTLIYDASFEGFLTAIFQAYEEKIEVVDIVPEFRHQSDFFAEAIYVISDEKKADRVWKGLAQFPVFRHNVYWSFLSEIEGNERVLYLAVQYVLETKNEKDYGHPEVLRAAQVTKMVGREKHRMEAFVRFQLTKDGIYFANVEPDFNVLPLIAKHFKNRYADQQWIIYDLKRNYGLFYDLQKLEMMQMDFDPNALDGNSFTEAEHDYNALWKDYFTSTNIKSRINMKLHTRHIPKRYWKYLSEKSPL